MSDAAASGNYRALLSERRLATMFALALVGRFGYAVLPLSLLFTISQSSGSFAVAATSAAVFGLATLGMPVQSRLLDLYGQRRVLPVAGALFVAFLVTVDVLALMHVTSEILWVVLCAGGGLVPPSLGPATRAQWREATGVEHRRTAYSLDAIAEETVFFLGPVVSAAVFATGPAWHGVALTAACIPIGVAGLVRSPYLPRPTPTRTARPAASTWSGPLRHGGFRVLLTAMLVSGAVGSAWLALLAGIANSAGRPAVAGIVEAVSGIAAVLGGAWWGRRRHDRTWASDLMALSLARVPLVAVCALYPQLWVIAGAVAVSGSLTAPTFVTAFTASDTETPASQHTEASTWVTTASNLGSSLGTAYAGFALTAVGRGEAFAVLAVMGMGPVVLAAGRRSRIQATVA